MISDLMLEIVLLVSIVSFLVMGADKLLAKSGRSRVSELSLLAMLGGLVGIFLGEIGRAHV